MRSPTEKKEKETSFSILILLKFITNSSSKHERDLDGIDFDLFLFSLHLITSCCSGETETILERVNGLFEEIHITLNMFCQDTKHLVFQPKNNVLQVAFCIQLSSQCWISWWNMPPHVWHIAWHGGWIYWWNSEQHKQGCHLTELANWISQFTEIMCQWAMVKSILQIWMNYYELNAPSNQLWQTASNLVL